MSLTNNTEIDVLPMVDELDHVRRREARLVLLTIGLSILVATMAPFAVLGFYLIFGGHGE